MHAIVDQLSPSTEQAPAIYARGSDVLVTAGAGTGKTLTLVARYLSLLADGLPLRSVVAITFTRKAAREMRNRVRDAVSHYLQQLDAGKQDVGRWRELYSEIDAARIGTIHSLCTEILRTHPVESRVDPRFEVLEEGQTSILQNQAVDEALAVAAEAQQLVGLFALVGETGLRRYLGSLLKHRLDVEQAFSHLPRNVGAYWREQIEARQQQALKELTASADCVGWAAVLRDNAASRADDRLELQRRATLAAIEAAGESDGSLQTLSQLSTINLQGGSAKAWPGGKEQLDRVKEALRGLRDRWEQQEPLKWCFTAADEELAAHLPRLKGLCELAFERYAALKLERNALDFDDLEQRALGILREISAVRAYWQNQVQAILVDEFQDTNARQRDLIHLINADQGRLFAVGDAKQSIYRFRGADVTVFRRERQRVRQGGLVLALQTSYRAHRLLIEGLNDLLRPVLGTQEDPSRPWVEPFAELRHSRVEPGEGLESPYIELQLAVGTKGGGALDRAADALASRLAQLVESGEVHLERGGRIQSLGYGDVGVLCRSSASFRAYEDALERAGIPFVTVAGRGFYGRPEVRDLLNALQALADPTDDVALVGLLRSPAFALSDTDLYRLCQDRQEIDKATPLWDILRGRVGHFSTESSQRAVQWISRLNGMVGRTAAADVLKAFLDATDYRAALLRAAQVRAARNVSKLLADAHASGIVGVGEFVEYVRNLRDVGVREGEARSTAEGAVQIMTVHAAKGLEFAIVVIGDVTYQGPSRNQTLIDDHLGILLPISDEQDMIATVYRLAQERDGDQERAEYDRLLYVAATRAREKLILNGCFQSGRSWGEGNWLGRLMLAHGVTLDCAACDLESGCPQQVSLQLAQTTIECSIYPNGLDLPLRQHRAQSTIEPKTEVPPPLLAAVEAAETRVDTRTRQQECDAPQRVWRVVPAVQRPRAPAWVIGKLVHESLASWRCADASLDLWVKARARELGLADARQLQDAARRAARLLRRFRAHALFREMDSAQRRLHEVPYSMLVDGEDERGVIDALYLQQGTWTVVEFKTDRVRDAAELQALLDTEDYSAQMSRYVAAVERLVGHRPRAVLCMLDLAGEIHTIEL